jgi:CBS domain containing-hemolysin-like protein
VTAALVAVGLLAANAFFVAAEFAFVAARRARLEALAQERPRTARSAVSGVRELSLMLAGSQLGITMASLGLGLVAEPAVARWLELGLGLAGVPEAVRHALAFAVALAIVVFLHMVVGEMAPKSAAIAAPERVLLGLTFPFRAFTAVTRPLIRVLNVTANAVVRLVGIQPVDERATVHDPRQLLRIVAESGQGGRLPEDQRRLLQRVLSLTDLDVEATMVPRPDVVAIPASADVEAIERIACGTGRSRIPVYGEHDDDVLGVLHVKDVLSVTADRRDQATAGDLVRPALVTPESGSAEELLWRMRGGGTNLAIVIDEHGAVTGLVTLEDLLEELIGEFEDESDVRRGLVRRLPDGSVVVAGSLRPDQLEAETGWRLPGGRWKTVAGLVLARVGRVPERGERVELEQWSLTIERVADRRIARVRITPRPQGDTPAPASNGSP